jgi:hypothetical protein
MIKEAGSEKKMHLIAEMQVVLFVTAINFQKESYVDEKNWLY